MLLGILSDIHDHFEHAEKAAAALRARNVEKIILLGDYCSPGGIRPLAELKGIPGVGILGNNDGDIFDLQGAFHEFGWTLAREFSATEVDGKRIAVYHGTIQQITDALVACGTYDIVLSGHTHQALITQQSNTLFFNPGTVHGSGKRATCGVVDTEKRAAEVIDLD
jgi:putative phosphoesterase